jgi:hypothetical protein
MSNIDNKVVELNAKFEAGVITRKEWAKEYDALCTESNIEYCYSVDKEDFNLDYDSVLEYITNNLEKDENPIGKIYWRGVATHPLPSKFAPDAGDIFETMRERAYDHYGGEWVEDFPDCSREKQKELESLINNWCDENLDVTFYDVSNVEEMKITEEDL